MHVRLAPIRPARWVQRLQEQKQEAALSQRKDKRGLPCTCVRVLLSRKNGPTKPPNASLKYLRARTCAAHSGRQRKAALSSGDSCQWPLYLLPVLLKCAVHVRGTSKFRILCGGLSATIGAKVSEACTSVCDPLHLRFLQISAATPPYPWTAAPSQWI